MTPESFTLWLPLPHRALSPNGRAHYQVKAKYVKKYRECSALCALEATQGERPKWRAAKVLYRFYFKNRGRRDHDNLIASMKSALDGIVSAELLIDDDRVEVLRPEQNIDRDRPRVEIVVTRCEG